MHCHYYVNVVSIIYLCIVQSTYAVSKCSAIFFFFFGSGGRGEAAAVPVFEIVIVSLTRMYASLKSHKLDFIIEVLNLILIIGVVRST